MQAKVFDDRTCFLGEGPLWHPGLGQLFWFDIPAGRLLTVENGVQRHWQFNETVSAAGWIDRTSLLIASESALFRFGLESGARTPVVPLEADKPHTRSNDGRADPWGGFWIGTMGKMAEPGAGAIHRFYRGELRTLFPGITIPNAICFTPDRRFAHFSDTDAHRVYRVALDREHGWPVGEAELFLDLSAEGLYPDGAVIDADGIMWQAQWGASRVAAYDAQGNFLRAVGIGAPHSSCPAFGGPDLTTLYCTTAREGLDEGALAEYPESGMVFVADGVTKGQAEHQVVL